MHSPHILGVGSREPGIVHEEVCVNKIEIHVIDEGRGVSEVRIVLLDINICHARLPSFQNIVKYGVQDIPGTYELNSFSNLSFLLDYMHLCGKFMYLEYPDMNDGTIEGRLRLLV